MRRNRSFSKGKNARKLFLFVLLLTIHCFSYAQGPGFVDTLFSKRIHSLNLSFEIPYNEIIAQKTTQIVYHQKADAEQALGVFFQEKDFIDSLLKTASLPEELQYLPLALSRMNVKKTGTMHTAGAWQLPYFVAVSYGLKVSEDVDERCDMRKATYAAVAYLQKLSEKYTDVWDIVIAYANSISALEAAKLRILPDEDIWNLYAQSDLPNVNIIPDFITWIYLAHFYQSHHIQLKNPLVNNEIASIHLQHNIPKELFLKEIQINEFSFSQTNPTLTGKTIPAHCEIFILNEKRLLFLSKEEDLYALADSLNKQIAVEPVVISQPTTTNAVYYTVKSGDVLGQIAQRNKTTVAQLKKWNNLKSDRINIGQRLIVRQETTPTVANSTTKPASSSSTSTSTNTSNKQPTSGKITYTVKSGDTLSKIARIYGVSVDNIMKWNNLKSDRLDINQKLVIYK